jgi:hypothetical protein
VAVAILDPQQCACHAYQPAQRSVIPLSAAALDALIDSDRPWLEAVTHAHFPDPLCAPPLMADALMSMREQVLAESEDPRHGPWLAISRTTREAVGFGGVIGIC